MFLKVYWNKKTRDVLVPTIAKTEAGYWLNVEPVERASMDDTKSVSMAIMKAAQRSGKIVPTPSRATFPKPILLSYSGSKSLSLFEKQYAQLSIDRTEDGKFRITGYLKAPEGTGFIPDTEGSTTLPHGSSLQDAAAELVTLIRQIP